MSSLFWLSATQNAPDQAVVSAVAAVVVRPAVSQPVDQPWVAMEGEDDRLVLGEQGIEIAIGPPVSERRCNMP